MRGCRLDVGKPQELGLAPMVLGLEKPGERQIPPLVPCGSKSHKDRDVQRHLKCIDYCAVSGSSRVRSRVLAVKEGEEMQVEGC